MYLRRGVKYVHTSDNYTNCYTENYEFVKNYTIVVNFHIELNKKFYFANE